MYTPADRTTRIRFEGYGSGWAIVGRAELVRPGETLMAWNGTKARYVEVQCGKLLLTEKGENWCKVVRRRRKRQ